MSVEFPAAAAGLLIVLSLLLWKYLSVPAVSPASPVMSRSAIIAAREAALAEQALPAGLNLLSYKIESVLGQGGCGITYLAEDLDRGSKVAIKEFFPSALVSRGANHVVALQTDDYTQAFTTGMQQFMNESRVLKAFKHPNVVRVERFFNWYNTAYMVMPYEEGHSLGQLRRQHVEFDQEGLLKLLAPLLDGLHAVHNEGFLHRDIKPSNIFVRTDRTPLLLDFGAVCQLKSKAGEMITPMVTPKFAPIEQYSTGDQMGPWTDIYALGAVLYLLVTGSVPPEATMRQAKSGLFQPAVKAGDRSRFTANMLKAIDWALQFDPERRPRSVPEFKEALRA